VSFALSAVFRADAALDGAGAAVNSKHIPSRKPGLVFEFDCRILGFERFPFDHAVHMTGNRARLYDRLTTEAHEDS
jgi:hypothetical protein